MKFTVVLVTQPSRTGYLKESLVQLDRALSLNENMSLLVIFNGASEVGQSLLKALQVTHKERIRSRVVKKNSPLPHLIFSIIRNEGLTWIHMPGDDDLVIPESYAFFEKKLVAHPESIAVAFTANTIDEAGSRSEKILKPLDLSKISKERALANALHKPPFVWPSLMFDSRALPHDLFASRFVFDWWVGINLLLAGEIQVMRMPLVQYRIHPEQESVHASEIRKRFEAEMMLQATLFQEKTWKVLHEDFDQMDFLSELDKKPPIYGDPGFGGSISLLLHNSIGPGVARSLSYSDEYLGSFAARHGVLMNLSEFSRVLSKDVEAQEKFNFRLDIKEGTCASVRRVLSNVLQLSGPIVGQVGCIHSDRQDMKKSLLLHVECSMSNLDRFGMSPEESVCRQIESQLHLLGMTGNQNAYWETIVLRILRKFLRLFRRARVGLTVR